MLTLILVSQLFGVSGTHLLPKFCIVLPDRNHTIGLQDLLYGNYGFGLQKFKFPFCSLMDCVKILVETMKIKYAILRELHIVFKYCLVSVSSCRSAHTSAAYWLRN